MDCIRRRLAVEEEDVVTACSDPIYGERLDKANAGAQVSAFPGIWVIADRLAVRWADWFDGDSDAGLVSAAVMKRAAKETQRLPGLRDILVVGHPVVTGLVEKLAADRDRIPAPDPIIVERLSQLGGFESDGLIVTVDGVPLPAGEQQTRYFIVQRYRQLYSPRVLPHLVYRRDPDTIAEADYATLGVAKGAKPDLIHLLAYDVAHVTDDMQETILSYSSAIHRDNLGALQRDHAELYVAIWRRDMKAAKRLLRGLRNAVLPPSHPKSRIRAHAMRLLYGTSLMNEFERLFEIIDALKVAGGVTRQSLQAALKSSSSMSMVRAVNDDTHRFLAGSVAHIRSLHPTMNAKDVKPNTADPILEGARTAFFNARGYWERTKRTRWIAGAMPVQYFLGVELAMLAPVALIQMIWNMARRERGFWLRGRRNQASDAHDPRHTLVIELAIVITGNICAATARSMLPVDAFDERLAEMGRARSDEEWRDAVVPTLIANPRLTEEIERHIRANEKGAEWPEPEVPDERAGQASAHERAMKRAFGMTELGQPGWTQGFLFEAWLRPDAELEFLRRCCRYVQYDPAQAAKRDAWNARLADKSHQDGCPVGATDIATGLPRQHPLERIQDLFRDLFDRLQVADQVGERGTVKQRAWREAAIADVAPLLAAVSPITLDPQLAERWWRDLDKRMVAIARESAWNS